MDPSETILSEFESCKFEWSPPINTFYMHTKIKKHLWLNLYKIKIKIDGQTDNEQTHETNKSNQVKDNSSIVKH